RVEEDVLHAGGLELLHEEGAARALHFAHRGGRCRRLAEGRQRLRHRLDGHAAHSERAQAGHEFSAGYPIVEILLDQILHGILLARSPANFWRYRRATRADDSTSVAPYPKTCKHFWPGTAEAKCCSPYLACASA